MNWRPIRGWTKPLHERGMKAGSMPERLLIGPGSPPSIDPVHPELSPPPEPCPKISGKSTFLYFFLHAPRAAQVRPRPRRARAETSRAAVPALLAMRNRRLVPLGLRRAAPRRDRAERARQIGIVARSRYSCCSLAISAGRGESLLRSASISGRYHSVHLRDLPELELAASDRVASAEPPRPTGRLNLRLRSF